LVSVFLDSPDYFLLPRDADGLPEAAILPGDCKDQPKRKSAAVTARTWNNMPPEFGSMYI
jgi:hypothetical protein